MIDLRCTQQYVRGVLTLEEFLEAVLEGGAHHAKRGGALGARPDLYHDLVVWQQVVEALESCRNDLESCSADAADRALGAVAEHLARVTRWWHVAQRTTGVVELLEAAREDPSADVAVRAELLALLRDGVDGRAIEHRQLDRLAALLRRHGRPDLLVEFAALVPPHEWHGKIDWHGTGAPSDA